MFGPEVGPAILTHGHSFAERLAGDEELVAEICERFETARSEGRFPILTALLTETSDEDLEVFFRSGWAHMALPQRESSMRRSCDVSPWEGDLEAYREDLYAGMAFGMHDMRVFARELRNQQRLFWRSYEAAFFTFLLPILFLVLLGSVYGDEEIEGVRGD